MTVRPTLSEATVRFCRVLRDRGIPVTVAESIDAVAALEHVDLEDRDELHRALRIILASRRDDLPLFDELFDAFWCRQTLHPGAGDPAAPRQALSRGRTDRPPASRPRSIWIDRWANHDASLEEDSDATLPAPSDQDRTTRRELATLGADGLQEVAKVARRMARRLAAHPSRRWRPTRRGPQIDLRRTVRRSLKVGGEPIELARRERRIRRTKLVLLCDISGSMDLYSRFLLHLLFAMQNSFARVESFVFATRLTRVTDHLRGRGWTDAVLELGAGVDDWSGGTRIGQSVESFNRDYPWLVDKRTVVIILSDGWETGDPARLSDALAALRARAGRTIWLNPLLGSPDYQALTRGMQAALPHLDRFASAHDLASLEALARHLVL